MTQLFYKEPKVYILEHLYNFENLREASMKEVYNSQEVL